MLGKPCKSRIFNIYNLYLSIYTAQESEISQLPIDKILSFEIVVNHSSFSILMWTGTIVTLSYGNIVIDDLKDNDLEG